MIDYHRLMTEAVLTAPSNDPEHLVWIFSERHLAEFRRFLRLDMGVDDVASESLGIAIEIGEPSNGEPVELRLRAAHHSPEELA